MQYLILLTLLLSHTLAKAEYVPSGPELDHILRQIGDFNLDLVGFEERGEEDVVYLQRRVPQEGPDDKCPENDCPKYNAWAFEEGDDEELKQNDVGDGSNPDEIGDISARSLSDGISETHHLVKRAKEKSAKICDKTKIDGNDNVEDPIEWSSYGYPDIKSIEDKLKKVYDYADYDQPNTKEWFQLKNIEGRTQDRDYVVDHILPWDMYPRFLMGQKGKTNKQNENMQKRDSADSDEDEEEDADPKLCKTLHMYWKNKIKFDVVQPVKQDGKWHNSTDKTNVEETPIAYIGQQYPGGPNVSAYSGEFVILEYSMSIRKRHLWLGTNLSPPPKFSDNSTEDSTDDSTNTTLPDDPENYKTMQFNLQYNKWWDNKDQGKEAKNATTNEGKCQAIGKFRDVLGVYMYHQDPTVSATIVKQIERIEAALKTMEEDILPSQTFKDAKGKKRPKYKSQGLAKKWRTFMKDEIDARIKKIEEWMETWAKVFTDIRDGNQIGDLGRMFQKRADAVEQDFTNVCGIAVDDEVIERIKLLLEAYGNRGEWKNPLA